MAHWPLCRCAAWPDGVPTAAFQGIVYIHIHVCTYIHMRNLTVEVLVQEGSFVFPNVWEEILLEIVVG